MNLKRYLVVGYQRGQKPSARLTANPPPLEAHEVAVRLSVEIPDELFLKPRLEASIKVPNGALAPPVIDAEVVDNIQETISRELGIDLNIALVEPAGGD